MENNITIDELIEEIIGAVQIDTHKCTDPVQALHSAFEFYSRKYPEHKTMLMEFVYKGKSVEIIGDMYIFMKYKLKKLMSNPYN